MKLKISKITVIFSLTLLVVSLGNTAALTAAQPSPNQVAEKVVIYGMPYTFSEFSAWEASSYANVQWLGPIQVGLYARSSAADGGYVPELAADYPVVSVNKKVFNVTLKSGLKFASGGALTADDVVFSFKVALAPAIDNAQYANPSTFLTNDTITKLSALEVSFELNAVFAFPLGLLSVPIVEKAVFGAAYDDCVAGVDIAESCAWNSETGSDAAGAGPYMLDGTNGIDLTNMVITLVRNPNYWNAALQNPDKIVITNINGIESAKSELASGNIDIMDSQYFPSVTELNSIPNINQQFVGSPVTQYLDLNHFSPYWGTGNGTAGAAADWLASTSTVAKNSSYALSVRKAFDHIVDREFAANELLDGQGFPANNPVPAAVLGWDASLPVTPFSIDTAKTFMEAAGYTYTGMTNSSQDVAGNAIYDGGTFPFFSLSILNPDTSVARITWAANFGAELKKIGVKVDIITSVGWSLTDPRTFDWGGPGGPPDYDAGGFDIFFVGLIYDLDFNPIGLWDDSGYCPAGSCDNFYNYKNDTVAAQVTAYLTDLDFTSRSAKLKVLQKMVKDDLPTIPIIYPQDHWAWAEELQGLDPLLLSNAQQEWGNVRKSGWPLLLTTETSIVVSTDVTTDVQQTTTTKTEETPIGYTAIVFGVFTTALVATYQRKK